MQTRSGRSCRVCSNWQTQLEHGWNEEARAQLEQIGRRFFTLLVPDQIRQSVFGVTGPAAIELDVQDHDIPWELLHDGEDFLARRHALGRRVIGPERTPQPGQRGVKVVIVGDPTNDLKGARQESDAIYERCQKALDDLTDAYEIPAEVSLLQGGDATKDTVLLDLLMDPAGGIDIFHVAGHAHSDPRNPDRSGISLANGNLRAFEARSISSEPLVFVNGCRAGQAADNAITFGAISGFASEFLTGGALGYIAPAWPIKDSVAQHFADIFYGLVIAGETIGTALLRAKQAIDDPDALAYVFYGRVGERLAIFSPPLTAGPYVNDLGIRRIMEIERAYPALELLAVNDLPWILWDSEDILDWISRIPLDPLRKGVVAKSLLEYVQEFGGLVKEGKRRLFCVINAKTMHQYIASRGVERWEALGQELDVYLALPNVTLILASPLNAEIEEIELCSKLSAIPPSPTESVYVFNKQTRFEQSRVTYNLFEDYNPQMVSYYWSQLEDLTIQSLAYYDDPDPQDVFSGVASAQLNQETRAKFEEIALEALELEL